MSETTRQSDPVLSAAIRLAETCTERRRYNTHALVTLILTAQDSDWYRQLRHWSKYGFAGLSKIHRQALNHGAETTVRIIDSGYSEERNRWWPLVPEAGQDDSIERVALMDAAAIILSRSQQEVPVATNDALTAVYSMLLGPRWKQTYSAIQRATLQAQRVRIG